MPRNGSGGYSLPEAPFVPSTPIESSAVNSDFDDIGDALTGSVASDGQTPITGALKLANAGVVYNSDPDTGLNRSDANTQVLECGGVDVLTADPTGVDIAGTIKRDGNILLPAGVMMPYGGSTAPDGWLLCYGQSLLRASYTELFAAIGTAYGAADGTHFNVPDLRGRVPAGKDDMGGSAASRLTSTTMTPDGLTLAAVGGTQTHTLTAGESAVLAYTSSVTDPGHAHAVPLAATQSAAAGAGGHTLDGASSINTASAATGITVGTTANAGGGAHLNVQPTLITNYIIYAGV